MNRRSFFARTVGAIVAAVVGPRLPITSSAAVGTIGAIKRAEFSFWRAQPEKTASFDNLQTTMRDLVADSERMYFLSREGPYVLDSNGWERMS